MGGIGSSVTRVELPVKGHQPRHITGAYLRSIGALGTADIGAGQRLIHASRTLRTATSAPDWTRIGRAAIMGRVAPARNDQAESRVCASCGRVMEWRAAWAKNWGEIRYCSAACRRRRVGATDRALEVAILELLDGRAAGATICPSEAARKVASDGWRQLMEPARAATRRLAASGKVEITQHAQVVDPSAARGPIRIRLAPATLREPERHRRARRLPDPGH